MKNIKWFAERFHNLINNKDATLMDDICINRHQGNEQSRAANLRVNKERDRATVLAIIIKSGKSHSKEIANLMGKQLNQISGRISELKASDVIEETGERINGCAVYRLKNQQIPIF